jgi:3-hydroxyisobutyrate dehydrogenase-like beta-hydroxyacid dehydrogenase
VTHTVLHVGFIGVGQMGRPMVDRLAVAGQRMTIFARRADARADLEAAGLTVSSDLVALSSSVDILILSLFSDAQVREVLLDGGTLAAMQAGSTLITHVTGSPDLVVELDARAPAGVRVIDGPMSGTADSIRNGRLTLLLGGDAEDIERVRPVLAAYADNILHVGVIGDAQRVKLINNLLFTVNLQMALAAAKLGEAMSISPSTLAKTLASCSGNSFALALFERMPPETMKASARPFLAKDVAVVHEVATSMGIDLGILGQLADWVNHD